MKSNLALPALSLRFKLILSYLIVTLAAILVLAVVVSLAVQNYFYSTQHDLLRTWAQSQAQQIGYRYRIEGETGTARDFPLSTTPTNGPLLVLITDTHGLPQVIIQSPYLSNSDAHVLITNQPVLKEAIAQALQGHTMDGALSGTSNGSGLSGLYICVPLHYGGQETGRSIGTMLAIEPEQYPGGFSLSGFLGRVNQAILIAGLIVALLAIIVSLIVARSLTRPLESLTIAASRMREGNYAQRVAPPQGNDELTRLALTFNAMADTIESDVTELHRQEQIRRDLLANIAHDLATPLTAIQGFSEALADNLLHNPESRQETALLIGREVQRLRRLAGDMQHMSSLESGHARLDLAPLDLHALVDETLAVVGPECQQAGIALHNEIPIAVPPVLADSDRLTQVFLNLLDNARRHTPLEGTITVGAMSEGKQLTIWVRDTGIGIDPANLPFIFERFYRADRARSGSDSSSGLGLAIVKAIITAHHGTIRAESMPSEGTRVVFTLPLAS